MSNQLNNKLVIAGTAHKVYPTGDYPSFVIKYMDGSYERYICATFNKKNAEHINQIEPGYAVEATIYPGSQPSKNDPDRWNNTNWCVGVKVTPF